VENTGLAGGDVNSTMVQICSAVDTRVGLWCLARLLIMPKAWERACQRSASVRRTAVSGFTAAARQIAAVVTSGVSHGFCSIPVTLDVSHERGMRISRTTLDLWELLELCDSGEAVVQALMYGLIDCVRCRRDLRRLPQVSQYSCNSRRASTIGPGSREVCRLSERHWTCGSFWSCATVAKRWCRR
jgi:hypothetical protein